jgi:hypothetical protein
MWIQASALTTETPGQDISLASGPQNRIIIRDGWLISASDQALLLVDLAKGRTTIHYSDGAEVELESDGRHATEFLANHAETLWVSLPDYRPGAMEGSDPKCTIQGDAMKDVVSIVEKACEFGPGEICAITLAAFRETRSDFNQCVDRLVER